MSEDRPISGLDRLIAESECRAVMMEYARRIDHGRASSVAELFTPEGRWSSPTVEARGSEGLRQFFAQREAMSERVSRHVVVNITITLIDADHALGRSVALEFRDDLGGREFAEDTRAAIIGDYQDDFVKQDGRWLFRRRHVVVVFKRAGEEFIQPQAAARA